GRTCHHCSMLRRPASIKLIDAFGIRIGVDGSWFVILFLLIFMLSPPFRDALHSSDGVAYLTTVVSVLLLFASLIVHRLGHALALDGDVHITPVLLSLSWLLPMNVLLLAFNLVPAFPLDGGRIARAIVWRVTGDRTRGTRAAARMGQWFAVLLGGLGLFAVLRGNLSGLWLMAIAWLIGQSARGALLTTALTEKIEGV